MKKQNSKKVNEYFPKFDSKDRPITRSPYEDLISMIETTIEEYSTEDAIDLLSTIDGQLSPVSVKGVTEVLHTLDNPDNIEQLDVIYDRIMDMSPEEVLELGEKLASEVSMMLADYHQDLDDRHAEEETQRSLRPGRF